MLSRSLHRGIQLRNALAKLLGASLIFHEARVFPKPFGFLAKRVTAGNFRGHLSFTLGPCIDRLILKARLARQLLCRSRKVASRGLHVRSVRFSALRIGVTRIR